MPADYPGTFLEFKEELSQKLIDQGMSESDFRITTTQVAIDTTDTSGWIVYDHYRDQAAYNSLTANLNATQKANQPYRAADNSHTNGTGTIESYFKNNTNTTGNKCKNFDRHIYSSLDDEGKASMVFAGYGTKALADYMIYPAASNSRRTFSFDLNPAVIDTHTLASYGFFLNAGINGSNVQGYALIFSNTHVGSIQKINVGVNAGSITGSAVKSGLNMGIKTGDKVRISVELNKDSVTIQYQKYDAAGNLGAITDLLRDYPLDETGFNGFGPLVNYSSHGCASLSIMKYSDLEMGYEASAFDALKNVQYYEGAQQKYFINLAGDNNDPGIPEETTKSGEPNKNYHDGINRMNENSIFYLSNADDGQIVTDSTKDEAGKINHQGLGSTNGFYAPGDAHIQSMAEYIYSNFRDGVKFQKAEVESELPLANFYIKDTVTGEQRMTIHLQHLINAAKQNETLPEDEKVSETVSVNLFDRSRIGTASGENGQLAKWVLTVTDPDNTVVPGFNKVTVADPSQLPDFTFTKNSKAGRYTFTLEVEDTLGNKSKDFSTYITAFQDNRVPYIEGENTGRNIATITLTDTGQGIDEDGITFIEDDRGSGVAGYWVTNDPSATPTESDWEMLPFAQHEFAFEQEIESTEPLVVWVRDECGNVGNKAVFQPTYVRVEDENGNPIDEYYVIGDKPIIVLPEDEDVPEPEDDPDNNKFSGWTTPGGDPVTPGTTPKPEDNVIVIRPSYSKDYAKLVYLANGGSFSGKPTAEFSVVSNASIVKKIEDHNVMPTRVGYAFSGWKLLKSGNKADADNEAFVNTAANVEDVLTQLATVQHNDANEVTRDTYYLVAQWKEGEYSLKLDANGGSAGNVRAINPVKYNENIGTLSGARTVPDHGRGIPSRPGYFFRGWSESNDNDVNKIFKLAQGYSHATVDAPTMPDSDKTIYAVWEADTSKFLVSFNSNGGSTVSNQAYLTSTATKYDAFMKPSRTGYIFDGWFEQKAVGDDGMTTEFGDVAYTGGEAFITKGAHTFGAKWTPRTDTKYTVDYYVNSGEKDARGNYIYTKVTEGNLSKSYTAATESTVSVKDADRPAEISSGGTDYWYNANSSRVVAGADGSETTVNNNVLTGVVTGSPALSLKLYYDRYFDVTVSKTGEGTCQSAIRCKEGTTPTVTWAPAAGSHVERVFVNGTVRDDLLKANSYTAEAPLSGHINVQVVFAKDGSSSTGGGTPKPKPPVTENTYYTIKTRVEGTNAQNAVDLTPTQSVKNGADAQVTWGLEADSRYAITSVMVDGVEHPIEDGAVDFSNVSANHEVVVTVKALPSLGGTDVVTSDKYTVTVNRYGGDDKVVTSGTATLNAGATYHPSWDATGSDYEIVKILVDGHDISGTLNAKTLQKMGEYKKAPFNKGITKNHVVDVYLAKRSADKPDTPPEIPDYTDKDQFVKIETRLVGAEGDITGSITAGAVVKKNEGDYNIDWGLQAANGDMQLGQLEQGKDGFFYATKSAGADASFDPDNPDYVCYELEKVVVNGKEQKKDAEGKIAVRTDTDQVVEVHVRPVLHTVTIVKYGDGTVSPTKSVYHLGNYKNLKADPASGSVLAKVVIDGEVAYELPADQIGSSDPLKAQPEAQADVQAVADAQALADTQAAPASEPAAGDTSGEAAAEPGTEDEPAADEDADQAGSEEGSTEEGTGAEDIITDDETPQASPLAWLFDFLFKGLPFLPLEASADETDAFDPSTMDQTGVVVDHKIEVYFAKQATDENGDPKETPDGKPVVEPVPAALHNVSAALDGGEGTVEGNALVAEGNDAKLTITPGEGYEVSGVIDENGNKVTGREEGGVYIIDVPNVTADHAFKVLLKRTPVAPRDGEPSSNDPIKGDLSATKTFNVTTAVQGGAGTIDGAGTVDEGDSRTVSWAPADPNEKVAYVFVDGVSHPELVDKGSVTFENMEGDHHVTVVFASNVSNVDTNGDGEPDVNVDNDGDGKPDTNVDTDGDGKPDVNKDTDGDGKPDVDIVDKDHDGKPDPVDPNEPDFKPEDHTPDLNKDTDGDGKPDVNVDPDGDGKPDVNVDTDGDGKPDVNKDTDGDGKPDLDIVDTDGDGKPDSIDLSKKPEDQPKPNVNVDTDGDGKPDLNVDTDGDGKPDLNIDTDGDGKPDANIDTDGDGIPDTNLIGEKDQTAKDDNGKDKKDKSKNDAASGKEDKDDREGNEISKTLLSQTGDGIAMLGVSLLVVAAASLLVLLVVGRRRRKE